MAAESKLETKLKKRTEAEGGWCVKLLSNYITGLPDRLLLLPGGRVIFVEVKAPGKKPKRIQGIIHKRLRGLGFQVEVVDSLETINEIFTFL